MNRDEINSIPSRFDGVKRKKEVADEMGWTVRKLDYWISRLRAEGIEVKTRKAGGVKTIL